MIKKLLKYAVAGFLFLIVAAAISYLIAPGWVKNKAISLLYPTITIEAQYQNQFAVEVPPVYELMYIACTLTPTFQADDNLISKKSPGYLEDVKEHFAPVANHELVSVLERKLKKNPYSMLQPAMRMFSLNYQLTNTNELEEQEIFHVNPLLVRMFKNQLFYFPEYLPLINDFARQSDFYAFYEKHQPYYKALVNRYNQLADVTRMWRWIEAHSSERYGSYRVIFSPLQGGFHNTIPGLKDPKLDMKQTWMFVSPPFSVDVDTLNADQRAIMTSKMERIVFTEIDHNYVNPISDQFEEEIQEAIGDYHQWWTKGGGNYASAKLTFNEYMTWGVFGLYARDTYLSHLVDSIISIQTHFMEDKRAFVHFQSFNEKLMKLYAEANADGKNVQLQTLYPPILEWVKNYNRDLE